MEEGTRYFVACPCVEDDPDKWEALPITLIGPFLNELSIFFELVV